MKPTKIYNAQADVLSSLVRLPRFAFVAPPPSKSRVFEALYELGLIEADPETHIVGLVAYFRITEAGRQALSAYKRKQK